MRSARLREIIWVEYGIRDMGDIQVSAQGRIRREELIFEASPGDIGLNLGTDAHDHSHMRICRKMFE